MADIASLGLKVDSSQAARAADALQRLTTAGAGAEAQVNKLGQVSRGAAGHMAEMERQSRKVGSATVFLAGALKGVAWAVVAKEVISTADAYTNMTSKLTLVTGSSQDLARTQAELFNLAQRTRAPLGEVVNLYANLARSTKGLGISQQELLNLTSTINQSMIISGTSAQAASGGLRQLGQAFASGVLRGDEFNSVMEQMPRLQQGIAQALGKTTGELRTMAMEGKLTVDVVLPAILASQREMQAEFDRMPQTVEQSMTKVGNSLVKLIGSLDKATGLTKNLAEALDLLAMGIGNPQAAFDTSLAAFDSRRLQQDLKSTVDQMEAIAPAAKAGSAQAQAEYERLRARVEILNQKLRETSDLLKGIGDQQAGALSGPGNLRDINAKDRAQLEAQQKAAEDLFSKEEAKNRSVAEKRADIIKYYTELGQKAGASDARIQQLIKRATAKINDPGLSKAAREAEQTAKRLANLDIQFGKKDLNVDLSRISRSLDDMLAHYQNASDRLETLHAAGLVDEKEYYDKRRALAEAEAADRVTYLNDSNARLDEELQIQLKRRDASIAAGMDRTEAERRFANEEIQIQGRLVENQAAMSRVQNAASTKVANLTTEQEAAQLRLARSYEDLRAAQQDYLNSQIQSQQMAVAALGMGEDEQERLTGLQQINDRYNKQRLDTARELAAAQIESQRNQLREQLRLINKFHTEALDSYNRYWDQLQARERDAGVGAREAIANYVSNSQKLAKSTMGLFETTFTGVEDSLAELVVHGKNTFGDLADTILMEMTRVLANQAIGQLLGAITGTGAGGSFAFGRAGNQAIANQVFAKGGVFGGSGLINSPTLFRFANGNQFSTGMMGEAGPEAVMPLKRGRDGRLGVEAGSGGGSPIKIDNHLTVSGVQGNPSARELQRLMEQSSRNSISSARARGARL